MKSLSRRLLAQWGFAIFALEVALTTLRVFWKPNAFMLHYSIFHFPGPMLWEGIDPYGITAHPLGVPGSGFFPYSPTCAMFFFSLFAYLRRDWALIAFLSLSLGVLFLGTRFALRSLRDNLSFDLWTHPLRHLVWLLFGGELMLSILYTKVEIVELGLALFALGLALRPKTPFLPLLILGFVSNWKLQFLPTTGLVLLVALWATRSPKPLFGFLVGFGGAWCLPLLRFSPAETFAITRHWLDHTHHLVDTHWARPEYMQVYRLSELWGMPLSLTAAGRIGMAAGAGFALFLALWMQALSGRASREQVGRWAYLLAFGLGGLHVMLFSPFSQNSAYVLMFPAVLAIPVLGATDESRKGVRLALLVAFVLISFVSSDFFPVATRRFSVDQAFRVYGALILLFTLVSEAMRRFFLTLGPPPKPLSPL